MNARLQAQEITAVEQVEVRQDGIVGRFHFASGARARTAVILLGGSEGGLPPAKDADDLARSGYPTLALGYFKDWRGQPDGLPASLNEIPLEYFFHAIDWLKRQPEVDPDRIVLMGQSRGGELVLLLGSLRPDVAGVIAFSPSDRVWGGLSFFGPPATAPRPAWTLAGNAVPFQKVAPQRGGPMRDWFTRSQPDEAARIPVDRIRGSVLLISSKADALWPSTTFADEAAAALAKRPGKARMENLQFDDAAHLLMGTGPGMTKLQFPGSSFSIDFGGTPEGTAKARAAAWQAAKRFLAKIELERAVSPR
jgi:dienelactone hydrolase